MSDPYYCPTSGDIEDPRHGGFDVCCDRPDLHRKGNKVNWLKRKYLSWLVGRCNIYWCFRQKVYDGLCHKHNYEYDSREAELPHVGMLVCDCRYQHQRIVEVDNDGDTIRLEDGSMCSFYHCCNPAPHDWDHPKGKD